MIHLLAALLFLVPQADTGRLGWVPNPRVVNGGWVSDPAHHLRPETLAQLNAIASDLEGSTTAELAIVVIDSLDGLEPAEAALRLHRRWGVGKASRDNGIVLLWSPALRKIYVSVGYGLEGVLPDARTGRIQDEAMLPAFRRNDFDAGMIGGAQGLAAAAREETYSGLARNQAARPARGTPTSKVGFIGAIAGGIVAFIGAIFGAVFGRRRWPRQCPNGHGRMRRLDEKSDDLLLAREELLEEQLESVDYDVWVCDKCDAKLVLPYRRWTSKFETCPTCKRRTCEKTEKVLIKPSYTSSGTKLVRRRCRNCAFSDEREVTIPRLEHTSSGGSSGSSGGGGGGGSSFGGGSSGGGGAGRSY